MTDKVVYVADIPLQTRLRLCEVLDYNDGWIQLGKN